MFETLKKWWGGNSGFKPKAAYDFGRVNRLMEDFLSSSKTFNDELRTASLERLRNRSRELARNDHNAVKFLSLLVKNVIGSEGITLQPKVMLQRGNRPNDVFNLAIKEGWCDWGKKENCSINRKFTWIQVQHLLLRTCAIDGEAFIRKVRRPDNPHLFSLQFLDAAQVDDRFNNLLPTGNRIVMGVEFDPDGAVVAYYVLDRPRGDVFQPSKRIRIPAGEILHLYLPVSLFQARGVPWMVSAAFQMNQFKGYQEAELIAARVGACQLGIIQKELDANAETDPNKDSSGNVPLDAQPGTFQSLAPGETMTMFDPKHPVSAYDSFTKACQRSIANGLDVSYMSLSGDLTGANYSSARVGLLDERATWEMLQTWMIESLCEPIYEEWLHMSLLSYLRAIPPSVSDYEPDWHPKSFPWVDPVKDADAEIIKIDNGLGTRTRALAALGYDFRETVDELADEEAYLREKGVQLAVPITTSKTPVPKGDSPTTDDTGGTAAATGTTNARVLAPLLKM